MKSTTQSDVMAWMKKNNPAMYYLYQASANLVSSNGVRDLGKLFAEPNEYIQLDWINSNTSLSVVKRDDISTDANSSGYDLITRDGKLKIQSKLRAGTFHLEQTRRISEKNLNTSSESGHVRYSIGESDIYLFSRPVVTDYLNITRWTFIAIPDRELADPSTPGYLVRSVPKKIWNRFVGKAAMVLESEYKKKG